MKFAMLFSLGVVAASAQVPTGAIAGVVRDPSRAAVSGARLTVVHTATKAARTETTSERGNYSFPALLPGEYELTIQADRFATLNRAASVEAGATTTADFDLRLGDVKESVTVESTTPQIQYDSQSVSGTINGSEIQNLPSTAAIFWNWRSWSRESRPRRA
jgi:Carboxypeptidase regulatory-like domain